MKKIFYLFLFIFLVTTACKTTKQVSKPKTTSNFAETYSAKLGINLNGSENKLLITTVADWLGVPYKYGGCAKDGTDCSCLIKNIYSAVYNKNLSRSANDMYLNDIMPIKKEELREGDLVFFKIDSSKPSHVGIYIKDNKFVHASSSKGVMISSLEEAYYTKCFTDAGRVKI